jgi:hypothetical protein
MRYGLDPAHPQGLVYATNVPGHGPILLAAMYIVSSAPDVGGSLTRWHEHPVQCKNGTGRLDMGGGLVSRTVRCSSNFTAAHLHVFTVANYPGGPFSDDLSTNSVRTAVKQVLAGTSS